MSDTVTISRDNYTALTVLEARASVMHYQVAKLLSVIGHNVTATYPSGLLDAYQLLEQALVDAAKADREDPNL